MPVWVWGWLEAFRFFRWCPDWMLPILNNWIWVCKLDLSRPDGCQFGFGGGSKPFVSLDGALTGSNLEQRSCLGLEACDENSGSEIRAKFDPFGPNFCYCAVYQKKVVFKRKRAVSSPYALFGPGRPTRPQAGLLRALGFQAR